MEIFSYTCLRYALAIFTFLLLLSGIGLIIAGAWVLNDLENLPSPTRNAIKSPAIVFIVAGALAFLVSFFGFCAQIRDSYFLLILFAILLFFILVMVVAAGVAGAVKSKSGKEHLTMNMERSMENYDKRHSEKKYWDKLQRDFHCCGIKGALDWPKVLKGLDVEQMIGSILKPPKPNYYLKGPRPTFESTKSTPTNPTTTTSKLPSTKPTTTPSEKTTYYLSELRSSFPSFPLNKPSTRYPSFYPNKPHTRYPPYYPDKQLTRYPPYYPDKPHTRYPPYYPDKPHTRYPPYYPDKLPTRYPTYPVNGSFAQDSSEARNFLFPVYLLFPAYIGSQGGGPGGEPGGGPGGMPSDLTDSWPGEMPDGIPGIDKLPMIGKFLQIPKSCCYPKVMAPDDDYCDILKMNAYFNGCQRLIKEKISRMSDVLLGMSIGIGIFLFLGIGLVLWVAFLLRRDYEDDD